MAFPAPVCLRTALVRDYFFRLLPCSGRAAENFTFPSRQWTWIDPPVGEGRWPLRSRVPGRSGGRRCGMRPRGRTARTGSAADRGNLLAVVDGGEDGAVLFLPQRQGDRPSRRAVADGVVEQDGDELLELDAIPAQGERPRRFPTPAAGRFRRRWPQRAASRPRRGGSCPAAPWAGRCSPSGPAPAAARSGRTCARSRTGCWTATGFPRSRDAAAPDWRRPRRRASSARALRRRRIASAGGKLSSSGATIRPASQRARKNSGARAALPKIRV